MTADRVMQSEYQIQGETEQPQIQQILFGLMTERMEWLTSPAVQMQLLQRRVLRLETNNQELKEGQSSANARIKAIENELASMKTKLEVSEVLEGVIAVNSTLKREWDNEYDERWDEY